MKSENTEIIHIGPGEDDKQYEKSAETNFGQFLQILTERYGRITSSDQGNVEWSEYPIDQIISEALLAIITKIAKVHNLKTSTRRQLEEILSRLNLNLELGIALEGGPEAVADKFEQEVIPQIEEEIAKLTEEDTASSQKVWQLPTAKLLIGLMNKVKKRGAFIGAQLRDIKKRNNSSYIGVLWRDDSEAEKVSNSSTVDDGFVAHILDWNGENFVLSNENFHSVTEHLKNGIEIAGTTKLKISACDKLLAKTRKGKLPFSVCNSVHSDDDLSLVLPTQFALFMISKNAEFLTADELNKSMELLRQEEDKDALIERFTKHLKGHFKLNDSEIDVIENYIIDAVNEAIGTAEYGIDKTLVNHIMYNPLSGKGIKKKTDRLQNLGIDAKKSVDLYGEVGGLKDYLGTELIDYQDGKLSLKELLDIMEQSVGGSISARILFVEDYLPEKDRNKAYRMLFKLEYGKTAEKLFQEKGLFQESSVQNLAEIIKDIKDKEDKHTSGVDKAGWKEIMRIIGELSDNQIEETLLKCRQDFIWLIDLDSVSTIQPIDWSPLRERINDATWQKFVLGAHLVFRGGEYGDWRNVSLSGHAVPWSKVYSEDSDDYIFRIMGVEEKDELRKIMKKYGEKKIFHWVYEGEEDIGEKWDEYDQNRKRFFAEIRRKEKEQAKIRSEAHKTLSQFEEMMRDNDAKIPEDLKKSVNEKIAALKGLLKDKKADSEDIETATEKLEQEARKICAEI